MFFLNIVAIILFSFLFITISWGQNVDTKNLLKSWDGLGPNSADEVSVKDSIRQTVVLNQTEIKTIYFSAESKAEDASGESKIRYSIYINLNYADDSSEGGINCTFKPGTHDWEKVEGYYTPKKPIKSVEYCLLFREHTGRAWFRNAVLTESGSKKDTPVKIQSSTSVSIPFTDSRISKYGRYVDDSIGTNLTWEGSWLRFKVSGTTQIQLNVQVNLSSEATGVYSCYVDNGVRVSGSVRKPASDQDQTITLVSGLTTGEHTIVIQRAEWRKDSSIVTDESIKIKNIILDDGGSLSAWPQTGTYAMLFLGDSWAGEANSVTRFMDLTKWNIWPVAFGGFSVSSMNTYYSCKALGIPQTDPAQQLCVIQFGVNDYNGGVTEATFKNDVKSIMNKVATEHSGIKFFLVQVPANGQNYFDKYGTVLSELAEENSNTYYISTKSIADSLEWSDKFHLSMASRRDVYAPFLDAQISNCLSRRTGKP